MSPGVFKFLPKCFNKFRAEVLTGNNQSYTYAHFAFCQCQFEAFLFPAARWQRDAPTNKKEYVSNDQDPDIELSSHNGSRYTLEIHCKHRILTRNRSTTRNNTCELCTSPLNLDSAASAIISFCNKTPR
jgi:hypothetical protein